MITTIVITSVIGVVAAQLLLSEPNSVVTADGAFARIIVIPIAGLLGIFLVDYRDNVRELTQVREQLITTRHQGLAAITAARLDVIHRVETSLAETLDELAHTTHADGRALDASKLSDLAGKTVRPLSHALAQQTPDFRPTDLPPPRVPWREVLSDIAARPLLSPWWMSLGVTIMSIRLTFAEVPDANPATQVSLGPLGLSVDGESLLTSMGFLALLFAFTWTLTWIVSRVSTPILRASTAGKRWLIVLISVVIIGLGLELVLNLATRAPGPVAIEDPQMWERFWTYAPILVIALVLAIIRAISLARRFVLRDLESANADLTWEVARIRLDLWAQQRQLAQAVHGPLQAAITASALLLTRESSPQPDSSATEQDLVRDAQTRISAALRGLANPRQPVESMAAGLRDIQRTWVGVCELSPEVSASATAIVDGDPTLRQAAVAIIGEAVANAAIHGQASRVDISVQSEERGFIVVNVRDNGTGIDLAKTGGLGSAFLDELTTNWRLEREGDVTSLTASLAAITHDTEALVTEPLVV